MNISPDLVQEKMSKRFADLPFVKVYIDDILIFIDGSYEDHMAKLLQVLKRLKLKNLQVNALKSYWAVKKVEYLGFILTLEGVRPQPKKVMAIINMQAPKTKRQLRWFIGLVNYYHFMWKKRSHIMQPLTELTSSKTKFEWKDCHQKAFEEIKQIVEKKVLLSFPDYTKPFDLHTDSSDYQLGAALKQGRKILAFSSKKLTPAQRKYGSGEKEMLSIVEALKEFRTMIFGYPIIVYTDHKNWTHNSVFKNARVMRWRMQVEEFAPTIKYIPGEKNVIADALSRLAISEDDVDDDRFDIANVPDLSRQIITPVDFRKISKEQENDKEIQQMQHEVPHRLGQFFENIGLKEGGFKVITIRDPITGTERILVLKAPQKELIEWYHHVLVHPGTDRLYNTLHQHFTWKSMLQDIAEYIKSCDACQKGKRGGKGYGKVPMKDVEQGPWRDIALDLVGPWKALVNNKTVYFHSLTMIDVFTSWIEIIQVMTKKGEYMKGLIEQEWLR